MQFSNSLECTKSELDLFVVPTTNTAIEEGQWDTIQPHPNYNSSPVIRYDITGTNSHYIDLSATELHLKFQLRNKASQAPLLSNKNIAVVNNFLHSIFEQCQVYLNNVAVENTNKCYNYRAYFENTLCYGKESKETFLHSDWYHHDSSTKASYEAGNSVTQKQKYLLKDEVQDPNDTSKKIPATADTISLCGKIHCDIFNINRYLLNNVDVKIVLSKAKKEFYMYGPKAECGNFEITIEDTYLKIRRVKISSAIMLAHAMALEKATAKYPIKRVLIKPFVYPNNSSIFTINGIHFGIMPTRVVLGIVKTDAFNGSYDLNPYFFTDIGINRLNLKVSSKPLPYSAGLKFDFFRIRLISRFMLS